MIRLTSRGFIFSSRHPSVFPFQKMDSLNREMSWKKSIKVISIEGVMSETGRMDGVWLLKLSFSLARTKNPAVEECGSLCVPNWSQIGSSPRAPVLLTVTVADPESVWARVGSRVFGRSECGDWSRGTRGCARPRRDTVGKCQILVSIR